jgi:hypothetical protein
MEKADENRKRLLNPDIYRFVTFEYKNYSKLSGSFFE